MTIMKHTLMKDVGRRSQSQPQRRMLSVAQQPLHGHVKVSQLDAIARLMTVKSQFSLSQEAFDVMLIVVGSLLSDGHILPKSMYEAQKLLCALKMPYDQIHTCPKGMHLILERTCGSKVLCEV